MDTTKLGYALVEGVGTMVIPSPRPNEVGDLVLEPFKWAYVDPLYVNSPVFRRYKDKKAFVYQESEDTPEDPDLNIKSEYEKDLDPLQKVLVRHIVTLDLSDQFKENISLANLVNDSGIPTKNSKVTVTYLLERHRPFLLAIQDLEGRHRKRKVLLNLIKKQLDRIAGLPS